jgi:hypothetical protein
MKTDTPHVYFSNLQDCVVRNINHARFSVVAAQCWFTNPEIFSSLISALKRKVRITVIVDYNTINFNAIGLDFRSLEREGSTVLVFTGDGLLHHKFAVIDSQVVITGSYNWTRSQLSDNLLVVTDTQIARQFTDGFSHIESQCHPLSTVTNRIPREITFKEMIRPVSVTTEEIRLNIISGSRAWVVSPGKITVWEKWLSGQFHELTMKRNMFTEGGLVSRSAARNAWRYAVRMKDGDILIAVDNNQYLLGVGVYTPGITDSERADIPLKKSVRWIESRPFPVKIRPGKFKSFRGSVLELVSKIELPVDNQIRKPYL